MRDQRGFVIRAVELGQDALRNHVQIDALMAAVDSVGVACGGDWNEIAARGSAKLKHPGGGKNRCLKPEERGHRRHAGGMRLRKGFRRIGNFVIVIRLLGEGTVHWCAAGLSPVQISGQQNSHGFLRALKGRPDWPSNHR